MGILAKGRIYRLELDGMGISMDVVLLGIRSFEPDNPKAFVCPVAEVPWPFCRNASGNSVTHFGVNHRHSLDMFGTDFGYRSFGVNIVRIVGEFDADAIIDPLVEEIIGPGTLYVP